MHTNLPPRERALFELAIPTIKLARTLSDTPGLTVSDPCSDPHGTVLIDVTTPDGATHQVALRYNAATHRVRRTVKRSDGTTSRATLALKDLAANIHDVLLVGAR